MFSPKATWQNGKPLQQLQVRHENRNISTRGVLQPTPFLERTFYHRNLKACPPGIAVSPFQMPERRAPSGHDPWKPQLLPEDQVHFRPITCGWKSSQQMDVSPVPTTCSARDLKLAPYWVPFVSGCLGFQVDQRSTAGRGSVKRRPVDGGPKALTELLHTKLCNPRSAGTSVVQHPVPPKTCKPGLIGV